MKVNVEEVYDNTQQPESVLDMKSAISFWERMSEHKSGGGDIP
jgi:hypothetical protein